MAQKPCALFYGDNLDVLRRHIADYSVEANVELLSSGPRGLEPILKDTAAKMKEQGLLPNADIWEGLLDARLVKGEQ